MESVREHGNAKLDASKSAELLHLLSQLLLDLDACLTSGKQEIESENRSDGHDNGKCMGRYFWELEEVVGGYVEQMEDIWKENAGVFKREDFLEYCGMIYESFDDDTVRLCSKMLREWWGLISKAVAIEWRDEEVHSVIANVHLEAMKKLHGVHCTQFVKLYANLEPSNTVTEARIQVVTNNANNAGPDKDFLLGEEIRGSEASIATRVMTFIRRKVELKQSEVENEEGMMEKIVQQGGINCWSEIRRRRAYAELLETELHAQEEILEGAGNFLAMEAAMVAKSVENKGNLKEKETEDKIQAGGFLGYRESGVTPGVVLRMGSSSGRSGVGVGMESPQPETPTIKTPGGDVGKGNGSGIDGEIGSRVSEGGEVVVVGGEGGVEDGEEEEKKDGSLEGDLHGDLQGDLQGDLEEGGRIRREIGGWGRLGRGRWGGVWGRRGMGLGGREECNCM